MMASFYSRRKLKVNQEVRAPDMNKSSILGHFHQSGRRFPRSSKYSFILSVTTLSDTCLREYPVALPTSKPENKNVFPLLLSSQNKAESSKRFFFLFSSQCVLKNDVKASTTWAKSLLKSKHSVGGGKALDCFPANGWLMPHDLCLTTVGCPVCIVFWATVACCFC